MTAQNSDSVSGMILPGSSSASRREASSSTSAGLAAGVALRRSSAASFNRERCESFKARLYISEAEFMWGDALERALAESRNLMKEFGRQEARRLPRLSAARRHSHFRHRF